MLDSRGDEVRAQEEAPTRSVCVATFYTSGMEHSPTSATGTGWERTPWAGDAAGGVGGVEEDRAGGESCGVLVS